MTLLRNILIASAASAIILSCSSTPSGIIPKEKMARLMADIYTAESVIDQDRQHFSTDSAKKVLKQSIFARHKVTAEQVDTSLKWYGYNMEKYVEVHDRTIELLEQEIAEAKSTAGAGRSSEVAPGMSPRYVVDGDSVDVWPDASWRRFSRRSPSDLTSFTLMTDQHWEKGDIYEFSSRFTSAPGKSELTIVAEYQDGSKEYSTLRRNGDGWRRVRLALDPAKTAHSVYGTLIYYPAGDEEAFADSISLVRTRFSDSQSRSARNTMKKLSNLYGR